MADKKARFECNDILKCKKKGKCLKSHLLYVKKVKKGLDHNAQFELKIAQVYVFQGKKTKSNLIKVQKVEKILDNKAEKYRNI